MKYLAFILFSVILPGMAATEAPASVAELFAPPATLNLIRDSGKVDACILNHLPPAVRPDGSVDRSTERYEETAFTPVPAATATELRDLLLNEKTYDWKAGNGGRRPQFYLRLRFHRSDETIVIDFCFMCHVLNVTKQGAELGHANFSPNGDLLLQAFLKIFPHDQPLQQVAKEAGLPP